ncbi:EcsC protein family protein [Alteribacillus persepolensis]|uniref:EcsC protein family protein n=1 Tax=Alteribacillus persepolensis TaxID=568899 RepID=A0A1G8BIC6_9BACI|nr:EcsC family protein [Alteribacillus persepolensis]SDH32320.1 EcsC protein family protein [Alteribacillus persepolensis]
MVTLPRGSMAERRYNEINAWEKEHFHERNTYQRFVDDQIEKGLARLPKKQAAYMLSMTDRLFFYTQSFILHSQFHEEAKERLIKEARLFNENINDIKELKMLSFDQLHFIHHQFMARQRLLALGQGGLAGAGSWLFALSDVLALFLLNLRTVQLSALCYGYDVLHPAEMMLALRVFHGASLPKHMQKQAWNNAEKEIGALSNEYPWFYEGEERITDIHWFHEPIRQAGKLFLLRVLRKKMLQGVPVLSMAAGAACNYSTTKQTAAWAGAFYEKRFLQQY